jgi:hypothetical protein
MTSARRLSVRAATSQQERPVGSIGHAVETLVAEELASAAGQIEQAPDLSADIPQREADLCRDALLPRREQCPEASGVDECDASQVDDHGAAPSGASGEYGSGERTRGRHVHVPRHLEHDRTTALLV